MSNEQNPLIPAGYDIVWSAISVLVLAFMILALISLARSAKRLNGSQGLIWTLVVIFVPVIGPLAWLSIGRRTASVQENN